MTTTLRARPDVSEYAPFYHGYVQAVPEGDIVELLRSGGQELVEAVGRIPEDRGGFRYGPEKWSIREVLGHLIDAERIFAYRALRVGRGDRTPLASFDENDYVRTAGSDARTIADLARELRTVREATVQLFESLPDDAWGQRGVASGKEVSLRALAYITAGHARHHLRILHERYAI
ncbi:MAG TPA: DinB family protein [Gemmatimonadaceae bacterium]|nr:DinB family protein [Gemmatimonadaceae bacterium]